MKLIDFSKDMCSDRRHPDRLKVFRLGSKTNAKPGRFYFYFLFCVFVLLPAALCLKRFIARRFPTGPPAHNM